MVDAVPKPIRSNQTGLHDNIATVWQRRGDAVFQRPISKHTAAAFDELKADMLKADQLIFDSCCGTGESSLRVGEWFPDALVIGIDKSADRLQRGRKTGEGAEPYKRQGNVIWVRADVIDFWRLAAQGGLCLHYHSIFYPNPYPKPEQLNKRWYAHPVFPTLLALGGDLEVRSNWAPYIADFAATLSQFSCKPKIGVEDVITPVSAFEKKYTEANMSAYRLRCSL